MSTQPFSSDNGFITTGNVTAQSVTLSANVDALAFNAVTSNVVVGTVKAVAGKFGSSLGIISSEGANDGADGVDINITAGDANESLGTPARGGDVTIQAGVGTTDTGQIRIGAQGRNEEVVIGGPGRQVAFSGGLNVAETVLAGNVSTSNITNGIDPVTITADAAAWQFGPTGNLTLPGNTFAVNYANGTPVTFGGASVGTIVSAATITPSATDTQYNVTALAESATIAAPSGSPTDAAKLTIRILDNGTAQSLTWNSIYTTIGTVLPTTTVVNKYVYVGCIYNAQSSKWDVVSVASQA